MELKQILELIRDFLSPAKNLEQVGLNEISIGKIIENLIENLRATHFEYYSSIESKHNLNEETDSFWKFALILLDLIEQLNESHFEPNPNKCYLNIKDDLLLNSFVQFMICFGIHYNLEDNVGISIERLSKYGVNITKKRDTIDPEKRNRRLAICLTYLYRLKQNKREHIDVIDGKIYRKHMHEIICSLIQITHSPNSHLVKFNSNLNQQEKISLENFNKWLNIDLFEEADGSTIIKSLLMAQGSSKNVRLNWFVGVIGELLTKSLLKPNSVMNVIRAVLDEIDAVSNVTLESDWKKCDIVARILAQCPRQIKIEDYIQFIAPQLIKLFFYYEPKYAKHFYRVAGSIYSLFAQRWPSLTQKYFTSQIISPLNIDDTNSIDKNLIISSKELRSKLDQLYLVYVSSTEPVWQTLNQLPIELIHFIFHVYVLTNTKINATNTKTICEDILKLYVRMMPNDEKLNTINQFLVNLLKCELILNKKQNETQCNNCIQFMKFNFETYDDTSDENDLIIIFSPSSSIKFEGNNKLITIQMVEKRSNALNSLIKSLNDYEIQINFLIYLFDEIKNLLIEKSNDSAILNRSNNIKNESITKNDQTLLELENRFDSFEKKINLKIIYFTQLSILFESIQPKLIIENHLKIIQFTKLILENIVLILKQKNKQVDELTNQDDIEGWTSAFGQSEYELLHLILSIISVFTTGVIEIDYEIKKQLQVLVPYLVDLKDSCTDSDLASMTEAIYMSIASFGGVKSSKLNVENVKKSEFKEKVNKKPLIEEINNSDVEIKEELVEESIVDDNDNDDDYSKALRDLKDPLLPIRAHGLVVLRRLIDSKYERCLNDKEKILEIFVKNLKSDDSYVYLAAINGLISLADYQPDTILNILLSQYNEDGKKLDLENRLKIGEVLTKTIRNFNELIPKYGPKLIDAFLVGCKNQDEFFRSSCLSNLGETCKILNYSLSQNIYEIINCLSSLIETDHSIQVKRSAIMVLKMIIEGLKKENYIQILGNSILPLYRLLSKTKSISHDDIIKLNCQLTADYLNELIKNSLFAKPKLEKEIKILNP